GPVAPLQPEAAVGVGQRLAVVDAQSEVVLRPELDDGAGERFTVEAQAALHRRRRLCGAAPRRQDDDRQRHQAANATRHEPPPASVVADRQKVPPGTISPPLIVFSAWKSGKLIESLMKRTEPS